MNRLSTLIAGALVMAMSGAALAQEQATVLKRDGSRVSGLFEAWNRNTNALFIRVSLGDQRGIPLGDAVVVEVAGKAENLPAAEIEAACGDEHVLVLRTGEIIRGRLVNIEGGVGSGVDGPRVLSFQPSSGAERRARFADVRRLYFGTFPAALAPSSSPAAVAEAPLPTGGLRVGANAGWVSTNVIVRRTDRVAFVTDGQVQLSEDPEDRASVAGSLKGRYAAKAPAPTLLAGALIGRIGNGPPFAIGDQTRAIPMPGEGVLWLAVNDDQLADNQGSFVVTLRLTRGRR